MQELRPVHENYLWRNFVYDAADYDSSGCVTNGASTYTPYWLHGRLLDYPSHLFTGSTTSTPALAFTSTNSTWLFARESLALNFAEVAGKISEVGLLLDGNNFTYLPSGLVNFYGLGISTVKQHDYGTGTATYSAGSSHINDTNFGYYCPQTATPGLVITNYYFPSQTPTYRYGSALAPLPGSPSFTVTNTSPLLIAGVGDPITVSGWAKMAITNGRPK
jgi:hypothetical protein